MFSFMTPIAYTQVPTYPYMANFIYFSPQINSQLIQQYERSSRFSNVEFGFVYQNKINQSNCLNISSSIGNSTFNEQKLEKKYPFQNRIQIEKQVFTNSSIKNRSFSQRQEESFSQNVEMPRKSKRKIERKQKPETKNLIKNYGRAILTFIIKNSKLRLKVLSHLQINENQFLSAVYSFRQCIHTISALRYLWQSHPFSKAFRILSCEYLRRYNLEHIFNSRVHKFGVYLKYQDKLMKSLEKPKQFQSIKQK